MRPLRIEGSVNVIIEVRLTFEYFEGIYGNKYGIQVRICKRLRLRNSPFQVRENACQKKEFTERFSSTQKLEGGGVEGKKSPNLPAS